MDHLGSNNDKTRSSTGKSAAALGDTQRVDSYDSQKCPISGEENGVFEYLEDIFPMEEHIDPGDILETQQINTDCETEVLNRSKETQVVADSEDEVDYHDGHCCGKNVETQLISEEDWIIDGEDSDRTEVLSDCDAECTAEVNLNIPTSDGAPSSERIETNSGGRLEEPGYESIASPPSANGICTAGSDKRDFTSVRVASFRVSGLAARYKSTLKDSHDLDCYGMNGDQSSPQREGRTEMKKSKASSSISKRLFTEELDVHNECEQHDNYADLAGLSYLNSEEPGESSQADALKSVDQLLKATILDYDKDAKHAKPDGSDNLDPAFSGKGAIDLAKIVHNRRSLAAPDAYDFNDSLEDEGGGEFFVKMKDVLSGSQKSCPEPRKLRCSSIIKGRVLENEEHPLENAHGRQMGQAHTEPNNLSKTSRKINQGASGFHMRRRNLNSSMGDEAANDENGIGLVTHMTAEDIQQARSNGTNNYDVAHQHEEECDNKMKKAAAVGSSAMKHHSSSVKRSCPLDSRLGERVKRSKRPSDEYIEASKFSVALRTRSKKHAINIVEAKADGQENNRSNISGLSTREVTLQNTRDEEIEVGALERNLGDNGSVPAKGLYTGDEPNELTRVARRTTKGKVFTPVCGSDSTSDRITKPKGLSPVDSEGKKGRKSGGSAPSEEKAVMLNSGRSTVPEETVSREAGIENDRAQVLGSCNKTESLFRVSSGADAITGQMVRRRQSNMRIIRKADLVKYAKLHARTAVMSINLQSVASPTAENDQCSSPSSKTTKTKLPTIGSTAENDQCSFLSGKTTKTKHPSIGSTAENDQCSSPSGKKTKTNCPFIGSIGENDRCSSPSGKTSKTKLPSIGPTGENDQCSSPSSKTTKTILHSVGSPVKMTTQPSDVAVTTPLVNCKTPTESDSPVCAGNEYYKQSSSCIQKRSLLKEYNRLDQFISPRCKLSDNETRKKRDMADVRVLFSHHLDQDIIRQQTKILARFGVPVASSIIEATHFVTDKFVRTRNMLEAIAAGKPVVTHLWLESCGQTGCYLDENSYLLRDTRKEKEIGFSMPVSLARASQQALLQGKRVLVTPNTKPGLEILGSLVKAVHGKAFERIGRSIWKGDKIPDNLIILSCEEDYATCLPLLQKGAAVYSSELLLNGIVVQRLEFSRFRLFVDKVKSTRSTTWIKKADREFMRTT